MGVDPNADTKRNSDKILVNFIANTEIRNDTTRVRSAESLTGKEGECSSENEELMQGGERNIHSAGLLTGGGCEALGKETK